MTEPVLALVKSEAGTVAVKAIALTYVVGADWPFQLTVEEETKLDPLTWSVIDPEPAEAKAGLRVAIAGAFASGWGGPEGPVVFEEEFPPQPRMNPIKDCCKSEPASTSAL